MKFKVEEGSELLTPASHSRVHVDIVNKTYNVAMELIFCDIEI